MKRFLHRILTLTLAVALLLGTVLMTVPTAQAATTASGASGASGKWGELTWQLDASTGELKISGRGAMKPPSDWVEYPWYQHRASIRGVTLAEGVTTIAEGAFPGHLYTRLERVTLPDTLVEIGRYSFFGCEKLTSVTIPNNVQKIDEAAFLECSRLSHVSLPGRQIEIKIFAFDETDLKRVEIRSGVTSLGDWTDELFEYATDLETVVLPSTLREISKGCALVSEKIVFCGTEAQWRAVEKTDYFKNHSVQYHDYQTVTSIADKTHTVSCIYCDSKSDFPHTFDNWERVNDTQHKSACTDCGFETTAKHTFDASKWQSVSDTHHKSACTDCGFETTAKHTFDASKWQSVSDTHHKSACTDCGFEATVKHIFGTPVDYYFDQHRSTCILCNKRIEQDHTFSEWERVNSEYHSHECVCGKTKSEPHDFGKWTPTDDKKQHIRTCADCGATAIDDHKWEDGTCIDCDMEKPKGGCAASLSGGISTFSLALVASIFLTRKRKTR